MRNLITLLAVSTGVSLVVGYGLIKEFSQPDLQSALQSNAKEIIDLESLESLDQIVNLLETYQQTHRDGLQRTRLLQDRLTEMMTGIDERLQALEEAKEINVVAADSSLNDPEEPSSVKVSDAEVGKWLDRNLSSYLDRDASQEALQQAEESLNVLPGVDLDEMQCGDRFCRATFSQADGKKPPVEELIGVPPFINEGFTIIKPGGRVILYFNQPGESLADLRDEAVQIAMGN